MAIVSPQVAAQSWARGLASAQEKVRAGIMAVTESPTAKAARRVDAMVAGFMRAAQEGRIQAGLESVSLEDWKSAMINKGLPRVAAGATGAQGKMEDFLTQFLPHLESGLRKLESMPRGDLETNINRATEMMRHNSTFTYRRRRVA